MRFSCSIFFIWCFVSVSSWSALALPQWSQGELKKLENGDLVPGASLLVESEEARPLLVPSDEDAGEFTQRPLIELPSSPQEIPAKYLVKYFQSSSTNYLVDPQRLLTMQETQDREGFLNFHAKASDIDIRLYLFDTQQVIPTSHSLERLVAERYNDSPLTCVVFSFMGDPSRTMLAFGGEGAEQVTMLEQRRILDHARIKSLKSSDASSQIEAFVVQLSIRLYWLEKSFKGAELTAVSALTSQHPSSISGRTLSAVGFHASRKPFLLYFLVGVSGALIAVTALVWMWVLWRKNRTYQFPAVESPRRLGADYGAGVGAVLGFKDSVGSPSSQRDQVPDDFLCS